MDDIAAFLKDREEALLSLDLDKINAYNRKYGNGVMPDKEEMWAGIHKARTAITNFPEAEKEISRRWLKERGYKPMG